MRMCSLIKWALFGLLLLQNRRVKAEEGFGKNVADLRYDGIENLLDLSILEFEPRDRTNLCCLLLV